MKGVMLFSFMLTLSLIVSNTRAQFYDRLYTGVESPQRHLFKPLLIPSHTYNTPLHERHLTPLQTHERSHIWSNSINPFNSITQFDSFEPDTEFVPLEEQQQQQHQQKQHPRQQQQNQNNGQDESSNEEKPFEVDVITSEVNGENNNYHQPSLFFQQAFPFFGANLFNTFGGFGIGTQHVPWWKGPNVCIDREEKEKTIDEDDEKEETDADEEGEADKQSNFGQFQYQLNSCVEKPNKYICTRLVNKNGKKKTLTISRQCCHGYGRPRNAAYESPCEKLDIKDIEATAANVGAKEFLTKVKNSGLDDTIQTRKNVTFFLPMDEAFTAYSDSVQSDNDLVEIKSDEGMKQLYLRHIVDGELSLDDLPNEKILKTQVDGQTIRVNSYQVPISLSSEPYRYTANCVPIEKHDKLSVQGMVHTLSGVLKPVDKTVMDMIRERADMSIMRTVLENTKLNEVLESEKPVTIFVPTDDAFEKLEPHLRRALKEGKGCASNILKNHILDLTFCSAASVNGARTTAYNLLGEPMLFNRSKSQVEDSNPKQTIIINGIAKITEADIMGSNGVMHVIDTILPTESALPLSSLMQEKNVTIFKRLLEAAGVDNKYDDMDNVTVFAPTDKALRKTKWANMLEESPEKLKDNQELIEFLDYHVVQPMIKTCDLQEQLLPTVGGDKVRVNLYSTHSLSTNIMNRATVNCARLVHFDDESCGSVLHQVDKPLQPAKQTLLQILESNRNYSSFLELVRMANLTALLDKDEGDYTLLVPKNDIFEEVQDMLYKDEKEMEELIKNHIVEDVVCCAGIIPVNWPFVRSIETINGYRLHTNRDRRPKIHNAGVTKCDIMAKNGIIHEINDVIDDLSKPDQVREPSKQWPRRYYNRPHVRDYPSGYPLQTAHNAVPNVGNIFSDLFF